MNAALATLLVIAASPPSGVPQAVVLIPMDKGAQGVSLRFQDQLDQSLRQVTSAPVRGAQDLFLMPEDDKARSLLKAAEVELAKGRTAFEKKKLDLAEQHLRTALKSFSDGAPAFDDPTPYAEALALYASLLKLKGDLKGARRGFEHLVAAKPDFPLDPAVYPKDAIALHSLVSTRRDRGYKGKAFIKSHPLGARVFIDGVMRGYTPLAATGLTVGRHLVRLQHPGFVQHGRFIEISVTDVQLDIKLTATEPYLVYEDHSDAVAAELLEDKPGPALAHLRDLWGIDRALLGTVKRLEGEENYELVLGVFDLVSGKKLAARRLLFQGNEFGELEAELSRSLRVLVDHAQAVAQGEPVKSKDPLEGVKGTEEWRGGDRARSTSAERKKRGKSGDPLEGVSGTEEW